MPDYRVSLTLTGPIATPLHSGTLFGHFCWALVHLRGEDYLTALLSEIETKPILFSSAMPAGFLPRPLLPSPASPASFNAADGNPARIDEAKQLKKREWINLQDYLDARQELSELRLRSLLSKFDSGRPNPYPSQPELHRIAHNSIDRNTGTTPETGGLYFVEESWPVSGRSDTLDVYVRCSFDSSELQEIFSFIGEHGYGRDASLGRGRWRCSVDTADPRIFLPVGPQRMSLSHASLSANMLDARYRLHTHYGKVGPILANSTAPFKHPLLLLRPGATFRAQGDGPYGQLLKGVHPHRPEIVHNAWHLTVSFRSLSE
jgi:CRISPR-associated protein Csm4